MASNKALKSLFFYSCSRPSDHLLSVQRYMTWRIKQHRYITVMSQGCYLSLSCQKLLRGREPKGVTVYSTKTRTTILACASTVGQAVPPMVKSAGKFSKLCCWRERCQLHFKECHILTIYMDCVKSNQLFYNILIWIWYTNVHEAYIQINCFKKWNELLRGWFMRVHQEQVQSVIQKSYPTHFWWSIKR